MGRDDAVFFQLAEHEIGINRVPRVTQAPSGIAEAHLIDAVLDAEAELIVDSLGPPLLDPVGIGRRPRQCLQFRMTVENPVGKPIDPIAPFADLSVGDIIQPLPKRRCKGVKHLGRCVQGYAANQQ